MTARAARAARRPRVRAALAAAALVAGLTTTAGCGVSLSRLPSTGGVSGPTYRLTARFDDVGNLTVGAKVKLEGAVVGQVAAITTRDYRAAVDLSVSRRFPLPAGSRFQIRFTTPLGEDYILVTPPAHPSGTTLADGAVVGTQYTTQAPTIEDTFAALSLLLNGGGLNKLQVIVRELSTALSGHTGAARDLLTSLETVVGNLDAHAGDIDRLLTGMKTLTTQLDQNRALLSTALEQFPATIDLLATDTGRISRLVDRVGALGGVVTDLVHRGQQDLLDYLDELRPTLDALAGSRSTLIPTFDSLIRFGQLFDRATPGDYLNIAITVDMLFGKPAQRPKLPASSGAAPAGPDSAIARLLSGGLTSTGGPS